MNKMLKQAIQKLNPESIFIPSDHNLKESGRAPKLFFYHLHRTGGLSFFTPLIASYFSYARKFTRNTGLNFLPGTLRVDRRGPALKDFVNEKLQLITGHVDYGFHHHFQDKFELMTIVRDPVKRVLSEYTNLCMKKDRIPNLKDFQEHYRREEKQNAMCRQLHPKAYDATKVSPSKAPYSRQSLPPADSSLVIENLKNNFQYYLLNTQANEFLEYFISLSGYPNILMQKINRTLPKYQMDIEDFKNEILELNSEDLKLFEYVKKNPRIPKLDPARNMKLDQTTVVLYETERRKRSITNEAEIATSKFVELLQTNPRTFSDIAQVFQHLAAQSTRPDFRNTNRDDVSR